jgi:uncharacterized membrane protein
MTEPHGLSDKRFENILGTLLRAGVILAAAIVVLGGALYLREYGSVRPDFHVFRGEPMSLLTASGIFRDALAWHSRGLIQAGLLLLIATPVARVAFSVVAFVFERDWLFAAITLLVLGILVYSLTSA